jgi:hypothetical protein
MKNKTMMYDGKKFNHNIQIWEENENFILFIPEYGVFAKNISLSEGYKELSSEKEKYFQKLNAAGISSQKLIDLYSSSYSLGFEKTDTRIKGFIQFALKAIVIVAIVIGLGGVGLVVGGNVLSKNMERVFNKIKHSQPLEKIVFKIEGLSDEQIDGINNQIRRASKKLKPVVKQLKIIWRSDALDDDLPH